MLAYVTIELFSLIEFRLFDWIKQYLSMKITNSQIRELALKNNLEYTILKTFISVGSGGSGFTKDPGKIIIQLELHYFKKREPFAPSGAWVN